jgi:O-antigen ligase
VLKNYNLLTLFSILAPFAIIVGSAVANFFLLLTIITFLFTDDKNYKYFYKIDNFSKILALFFIYILVTSFFVENNFYSSKKAFFYLKFFFFFIALKICVEKKINFFDIFLKFFLPIFLIVLLDGLIQAAFQVNSVGIIQVSSRVSGFFGDEWILGAFVYHLSPVALLSVLFYKNISNLFKNIFLFIIICLSILTIYVSGERTIFFISIIYFISIASFIFFIKKKIFIFYFILFIIFFISLFPSDRMFKSFDFKGEKNLKTYSTYSVYKDLYSTAYKMFLDKKLFGTGVQSFRINCLDKKFNTNKFGCSTHPHNYYFQVLGENGIIGFLIFLSIIIFLLKDFVFLFLKWLKNKKNYKDLGLIIILINIIISFTPIVPTGNIYSSVTGLFIFFKLAIYFGLKLKKLD